MNLHVELGIGNWELGLDQIYLSIYSTLGQKIRLGYKDQSVEGTPRNKLCQFWDLSYSLSSPSSLSSPRDWKIP
ncbi:MAG: hypothetical protein F6K47_11325 [Symploca sp. SIO2E6]|nr:hypothetical protein [Symploca sp. SIO2E6]